MSVEAAAPPAKVQGYKPLAPDDDDDSNCGGVRAAVNGGGSPHALMEAVAVSDDGAPPELETSPLSSAPSPPPAGRGLVIDSESFWVVVVRPNP